VKRIAVALVAVVLSAFISPVKAEDFTFVHISDPHVGSGKNAEKDSELFREISKLNPRPAFVAGTGDLCEIGTPAQYKAYREILSSLAVPSYQAPGNHDVRWNPLGKEGFSKGSGQPMYQSWSYGGIHFVLLDSTTLLQHWGHFDSDMLAWLKADLKKWGTEKPVIIGFHHWIGRESVQVDNEQELLDLVEPYNVRLWLQGHGHSNIDWNVNGAPAVMVQGLYQGAYDIVTIKGDTLHLSRRFLHAPKKPDKNTTKPTADPADPTAAPPGDELLSEKPDTKIGHQNLLTISLKKPIAPRWSARFEPNSVVHVLRGNLPADATVSIRENHGKYRPMDFQHDGWVSRPAIKIAGEHLINVQAELKDGRCYTKSLTMTVQLPGVPKPAWEHNVGGAVMSRLVRDGATLYVPSMSGDLVALDASGGTELWGAKTGGSIFSTPQVDDGTVYFGSADHFVYAVDAQTGRVKWKKETGGAVFGGAAVAKGIVCIASCDRFIYGLDVHTGDVKWKVQTGGMTQSKVATDGSLFFVGTWDNTFRALRADTGQEAWSHKFGKTKSGAFSFYFAPAIGAPCIGDGKVFISSNDGLLHAVDIATGKLAWETPQSHQLGYCGPLFSNGKVYQGSLSGNVFCFDASTGKILWQKETGSAIYDSSCALAAGDVYIGRVDGVFCALSAKDGSMQWQYALGPGHLLASPTTDSTNVYIASMSGKVTALPLR
jgi:outer membrane protein assembly factor BamB